MVSEIRCGRKRDWKALFLFFLKRLSRPALFNYCFTRPLTKQTSNSITLYLQPQNSPFQMRKNTIPIYIYIQMVRYMPRCTCHVSQYNTYCDTRVICHNTYRDAHVTIRHLSWYILRWYERQYYTFLFIVTKYSEYYNTFTYIIIKYILLNNPNIKHWMMIE